MSPVHPRLHRTPLLISGPHADAAAAALRSLDMAPKIHAGPVGSSSAIKMIRSVMIKGLEALACECALAGRAAGVDAVVLASLDETFPGFDWKKRVAYMMERVMTHGVRRAAEMREVALTVDELGLDGAMSRGAVAWQQRDRRAAPCAPPTAIPRTIAISPTGFCRRSIPTEKRNEDLRRRRRGRVRHQAPRRARRDRRRRGRQRGRRQGRRHRGARRQARHPARRQEPRPSAGAPRRRGGHSVDADPDARRPGDRLPEGGQACAGRNPDGRQSRRQRGAGHGAAGDRPRRDGRPRAALQPQPSMDPQQDRRRRAEDPADGRADLFLPPHQPQRARPAALVGPTICCGTTPATPSISSSTRPARSPRKRSACKGPSIRRSASRWTCRSA